MARFGNKGVTGLADWLFIAIIVGLNLLGYGAVAVTKTPDSPMEQLAEKVLKLQTGEEKDFSAHIKKDEDGKVIVTEQRAVTTKLPGKGTMTMPSDYSK
jgi:hypothetical protein